jgi:diguanylate cyclase (GGDEF)-like protein
MASKWRVNPLDFGVASLVAAVLLVAIVAVPQYLSRQARLDVFRQHVGEIGKIAASVVDGDLHRQLLDPANYSEDLYARALAPLVQLHSADPDIFYLYTMVERDGVPYFVLDTAASPNLRTQHQLEASGYMEAFDIKEEFGDEWLDQVASGKVYVTPSFEEDAYGSFLTAHAPIYDRQGRYSGFVGVDFDAQYYSRYEARFRVIAIASLAAALLLALAIGYLVALYHATMRRRLKELHDTAIHDSLTGLLNRRGVMEIIKKDLEAYVGKSAMLLIDINNLTTINDVRGHVAGDAVLARTSEAVLESLREGDLCGRLGDEFMIYARDCDAESAVKTAEKIFAALAEEGMLLAGARFSVSVGIAVCDGDGADFARMHREAEEAMQLARSEGDRIGVAPLSEACRQLGSVNATA